MMFTINKSFYVWFVLLLIAMAGTSQAGLWKTPVINHSFEEQDLYPDEWSNTVLSWFEVGGAWEEYGTASDQDDGNLIPRAPDGTNWAGLEGGRDSNIYQQIGTYTGPMVLDVDFYIGLRTDREKGPIMVSLWIGGVASRAIDQRPLEQVGATMIDSATWTHEEMGGEAFGIVHVSTLLEIEEGDGAEGEPIWLQLRTLASAGQMFLDCVTVNYSRSAWKPYPVVGAENVRLDETLSWNTGSADPNHPEIPNPEITKHFIYISDPMDPAEPNLAAPMNFAATINVEDPAEFAPTGGFERDKFYIWRVDEGIDDYPPGEPNNIEGHIWRFTTIGYKPVLDPLLPEGAMVQAGEDVLYTVDAMNPYTFDDTGLSYQWYKVVPDGEDTAVGTDAPGYEITDAQIEDEGEYYCRVTINSTGAYSDSRCAVLAIKRLMAHWPMEDDPNDIIGDVDGQMEGQLVWGDGIDGRAVYFDEKKNTRILFPTDTLQRRMWTISLWVYIPDVSNKDDWQDILGSGPTYDYYAWHHMYICAWIEDTIEFLSAVAVMTDGSDAGPVAWSWWPYTKEQWYMLTATYDARTETHSFYVNGEKMDDIDKSGYPFVEFGPYLSLGADWNADLSYAYTGWVDDMRFYSYPMSHFEVAQMYVDITGQDACLFRPWADLNEDCRVNLDDFAWMAEVYLTVDTWSDLDQSGGVIDLADVVVLLDEWMDCFAYPSCMAP